METVFGVLGILGDICVKSFAFRFRSSQVGARKSFHLVKEGFHTGVITIGKLYLMPYDAIASLPIDKLNRGDLKSFQSLYQLFYSDLVQKAASLLKQEDSAAAVVNHSYIKCWLKSEALTSIDYISAFLTTTVRNHCLSCHNGNGFRSAHYSHILEAVLSEATRNGLTRKAFLLSFNALPAPEMNHAQVAFRLFYERHMAVPDIAIQTGKDSQATGKALNAAFQALHLILYMEDI